MSREVPDDNAATSTSVKPPPRRRQWWLVPTKLALVALLAWAIRDTLTTALAKLDETTLAFHWPWFLAGGVAYLVGLLPCGLFWRQVLWKLGQRPGIYETLRAYYIGHLGKYVPGKALVVVLRAGLIRGARVDTAVAALSVFVETLTQMAVGALIAAVVLAALFRDQMQMVLLAAALMAIAGVPILPPVLRRLVRWLGVGRKYPHVAELLTALDARSIAFGWPAVAGGWFVVGGSVWSVTRGMGLPAGPFLQDLVTLTAIAALSTVAGFLSLIPGGLGVRDLILTTLLVPYFREHGAAVPETEALAAAVLVRVVWLVSELVIAAALYPVRPRVLNDPKGADESI